MLLALGIGLLLLLTMGLGVACSSSRDKVETVRGLVVDVKAVSITEMESLTVRDEDGRVWRFTAEGFTDPIFTPSHLRQHGITGEMVTIYFKKRGDELIIVRVTD